MAGVELDATQLVEVGARRLHELDRAVDLVGHLLVTVVSRVLGESTIPRVHLAEVGEPTLGECPHQIQCRGGGVVTVNESARVGSTRLRREVVAVHDVAAVGRQRHIPAGLGVAGARLGELAGHATHLDDRLRCAVGEHDRHLQDRLDAIPDLLGGRAGEGLGAVAALQQECITLRGARESLAQNVDLTGEHQRRQAGDLLGCRTDLVGVRPLGLLLDGKCPPIVEARDHCWIGVHDGFGRVNHE